MRLNGVDLLWSHVIIRCMEERDWWKWGSLEWADAIETSMRHMDRLGILFDVARKDSLASRLAREPGQKALAELLRMGFLFADGEDGYPYSITASGREYASAVESGRQLSLAAHRMFQSTRDAWTEVYRVLSRASGYRDDEWIPDDADRILVDMAAERVADLDAQERVNRRLLRRIGNAAKAVKFALEGSTGDGTGLEGLIARLTARLRETPESRASAREEARVAFWRARAHMESDRAAIILYEFVEKDERKLEEAKRKFESAVEEEKRAHERFVALGCKGSEI